MTSRPVSAAVTDKCLMQIGGHDAEQGPKSEDVPAVTAKERDCSACRPRRQRIMLARDEFDERGLAGAVRADDGGVLPWAICRLRSSRIRAPPLTSVAWSI